MVTIINRGINHTGPAHMAIRIIWYVLYVVELLLAIRFVLRLIGANPAAGFSTFIYNLSAPLVDPFVALVRTTVVQGATFEWITLAAMIAYWLLAEIIVKLIAMVGEPHTTTTTTTV